MTTTVIDELKTMTVYRETSVGWDEKSLANETVNEDETILSTGLDSLLAIHARLNGEFTRTPRFRTYGITCKNIRVLRVWRFVRLTRLIGRAAYFFETDSWWYAIS